MPCTGRQPAPNTRAQVNRAADCGQTKWWQTGWSCSAPCRQCRQELLLGAWQQPPNDCARMLDTGCAPASGCLLRNAKLPGSRCNCKLHPTRLLMCPITARLLSPTAQLCCSAVYSHPSRTEAGLSSVKPHAQHHLWRNPQHAPCCPAYAPHCR